MHRDTKRNKGGTWETQAFLPNSNCLCVNDVGVDMYTAAVQVERHNKELCLCPMNYSEMYAANKTVWMMCCGMQMTSGDGVKGWGEGSY